MNPDNDRKYVQVKKVTLLIAALILAALFLGWLLGRSSNSDNASNNNQPQPTSSQQASTTPSTSGEDVKSLVTFKLPDGWTEASCPNAAGSVFIIPAGAGGVDCDANPSAPVKVSVDTSNSDDCNDLQNVQNVSKHICSSLFINDKKTLKAETVYNQDSSYKKATTVQAYYINTGKGIIKVEYVYEGSNEYQTGFDELAKSIAVK
ncbi:hypothetical protein H0X10_02325 [Candidatus Saccharibacteria bacterium]|nr:hypothetical protein [Candidatus Saccharibacteria bacterium]